MYHCGFWLALLVSGMVFFAYSVESDTDSPLAVCSTVDTRVPSALVAATFDVMRSACTLIWASA